MKVSQMMTFDPATVRADDNALEAASRMSRLKVRHLPVVDQRGQLEGIVTDRDLRHHLLSADAAGELGRQPTARLLEQTRVVDIMSSPAYVATGDEELPAAAARMREHRVGALPVVEGQRLVGIITETDLLRRIVDADENAALDIVVSYP